MSNRFRIKALTAAIGLAAAASLYAAPASQAATNNLSLHTIHHATRLHAGDTVLGALSQGQSMNVAVSLKLRNKAQLDAFVANPHHPNLTPAQFNATYAPTQAQAQAVANFLKKQGFANVQIAPNRQLVTASGQAATAASAFHTSFVRVHTHDGRNAYATSSDVKIPASLQDIVQEVVGLQNVHIFHVLKPVHVDASGSATGHKMTDFAQIYNAGSTATGSTINVGVITEGSMTNVKSDFSSFLSQNPSLGSIPLNVVAVDGAGSDTSGDGEWDMDTQSIAGISGGVKALYLYDTSSLNTQPLLDAFNKAVTDNVVRVINVSIGGCETGSETNGAATGDNIFEQASAQGQTFSISSGDSGADECGDGGVTPSWPSDSQYVVSVGGTELYTSGTTWTNETVWNNLSSNEGATGGSPSTFEPQPSWQNGVGQNAGSQYRGLPDVAFDASPESGSLVLVDGQQEQIGGTSLASPLFVGVWARTLATNPQLGFAAPLIYADAKTNYAADFHDVTSGNNSGETAATGWDYTTGFGSINIANFVSHVAGGGSTPPPSGPTANFTYTASGLTVSFTDGSSDTGGTISSHSWNFGDNGTSTSASPSHTYAAAGTYNVTETVTDSNGKSASKTESVTVTASGGGNGGTFSNNTAKTIGDNATITSNISVTGEPGAAPSNLQVHVNITHNWSGDLEIVLYAPNGAYAILQQPDYNDDGNINATWTVNASSVQGNGTWKLKVIDNDPWYLGDSGKLNSWSLTF
ncbi:protease pro-enzyme activation domain-containing protein [Fulvimonas sp. R45]|uniref:protease pro-enzyme activation domain-containing protein n=1 Tax=Fulvimonas sp. R45 TaxID=3045937 RepID=UPI00265FC1FC|nr:protease pro-enzyme activation domain-containing protein [Fulvimonas sp. R45]MDO1528955.1 protease pro-enzyme activation domain-containing protein [Fulvimonas sp. R45]